MRPGGDRAGGVVGEGDGVVGATVAVLTDPAGVRVLAVPTFLVSNAWVNVAVSRPASVPAVMVGIAVELVVAS